jgi:hypothetical protein
MSLPECHRGEPNLCSAEHTVEGGPTGNRGRSRCYKGYEQKQCRAMQAATLQLNPASEGTQPAQQGGRSDGEHFMHSCKGCTGQEAGHQDIGKQNIPPPPCPWGWLLHHNSFKEGNFDPLWSCIILLVVWNSSCPAVLESTHTSCTACTCTDVHVQLTLQKRRCCCCCCCCCYQCTSWC